LSAVLRDDPPPLRTIASGVPRSVERITVRCIEKDPRQRYQTAADLKRALEDARDDLVTTVGGIEPASATQTPASGASVPFRAAARRGVLRPLGYVAAGAAIGALGLLAAGAFPPAIILTPRHSPFITEDLDAHAPAWAPDGRSIAYHAAVDGTHQLFIRSLDAVQPTQLTRGTSSVGGMPCWSPDGTRVYFWRDDNVLSAGIAGGEPVVVARNVGPVAAFAISPDARSLVFARFRDGLTSLWTIETSTGEERRFDRQGLPTPLRHVGGMAFSPDGAALAMVVGTTTMSGQSLWIIPWPDGTPRAALVGAHIDLPSEEGFSWMPDSRRVVFNGSPAHETTSRLFLGDTISGAVHQITTGANSELSPSVSPDGSRIAFVSRRLGSDLLALPVDGTPPLPVLQSSRNESFPDMSSSGALAYVTDADGWPKLRLRMGTDAWSRRIGPDERGRTNLAQVRLSPDGQRLSVDVAGAEHTILIYAVAGGAPVRLDRESTDQHGASWSPDGNWIAYRRLLKDRWELVKAPVGGGSPVVLAETEAGGVSVGGATDWSPTGAWIAHIMRAGGVYLVAADGKASRVLAGPRPASFRFSRDGSRLFAVRRGEGRRWELASWEVDSGRELRVVALPIAASTDVQGMALSPDESRIIVGVGTPTSDIWMLEQFEPPVPFWRRWFGH
jgi:Tol biopolymer transport system component